MENAANMEHVVLFIFLLLATAAALERLNEYLFQPLTKRFLDQRDQAIVMRALTLVLAFSLGFFLHDRRVIPDQLAEVPVILFIFIIGLALPFGTEGVHQMLRLLEEAKKNQIVQVNGHGKEETKLEDLI